MLASPYEQATWVYACVRALADQIAQIPFCFSSGATQSTTAHGHSYRAGTDILTSGPAVELFDRPHAMLSRYEFWDLAVTYLMLRGKVYVVALDSAGQVIDLTSNEKPESLLVLNTDLVQRIYASANRGLTGWRYTANNRAPLESQVLLPEEVAFIRLPHPFDFYDGLAPLSVARLAAQTDYASSQFMKGLMLNNADTGIIVTSDQQFNEEQQELVKSALRERKRLAGTADRPLFLGGGAKIEKPGLSAADMQFLENRKFNRQEICAVFGVPQEILGFTEDANRSVGQSSRLNFIENRVVPLCRRLEPGVAPLVDLASGKRGKKIVGWFDEYALPIMQAARRERYAAAVGAFGIGVPINTCNQVFDLGLPGDLPHGTRSYLPFNLQEVGAGGELPGNDKPNPSDQNQSSMDPIDRALAAVSKAGSGVPAPLPGNPAPRGVGCKLHICTPTPEWEQATNGSIRLKVGKLHKFFFQQRMRVLAKMEELFNGAQSLKAKSAAEDIAALFDMKAENAALLKTLKPLLIADLEFGGAQLFAEIGLTDFKLPPEDAIAFLRKRENKITGINDETFGQLTATLEGGLQEGETYEQLVKRVKSVFQEASDFRANTIATTETNTAVNGGRFGAMAQAKVERKGWKAANLDNVRPSHLKAEQDYQSPGIPIDQAFRVGGFELMHPGDPSGPAQEVINCRCFLFAILDEGKALQRLLSFEEFQEGGQTK
jgi:HK97 family phage portal protein